MIKQWINDLIVYINYLPTLERIALTGLVFILLIFSIYHLIKGNYNQKTIKFKIAPIIFTAIFLGIFLFIVLV